MVWKSDDPSREPTREEIDRTEGAVVLEFGTGWCGHCRALAPQLAALLDDHPAVRHIHVEDGPGKPLGRSFQVKLWPTLVFRNDGQVVERLVRPRPGELRDAFKAVEEPRPARGND